MDSLKFLCKIDPNDLESKPDSDGISFKTPCLVAYYDANYDTVEPANKIFYFKKPKPENYPIDLNLGYHTFTDRQPSLLSPLNFCFKYAMSPKAKISLENIDKIKIFTQGSILKDIMEIYYQKKDEQWQFSFTRYNGNLYMFYKKMPKEQYSVPNTTPKYTHNSQFLKNVFTESLHNEPNINEPWNANKRLIGIRQSSFGEFEIIYSGAVYGIQAEDEFKNFDDMKALNSCRFVLAKQMWSTLRKHPSKNFHYWLQAFLLNATDIYFAYKGTDGIVREPIVHKRVSDLPKEFESHWKPSICTGFLYKFLHEVNNLMSNDNVNDSNTVYDFYVDIKSRTVTYKIFKDDPEKVVITPDYMEYCHKNL